MWNLHLDIKIPFWAIYLGYAYLLRLLSVFVDVFWILKHMNADHVSAVDLSIGSFFYIALAVFLPRGRGPSY